MTQFGAYDQIVIIVSFKNCIFGVPVMAQWLMNPTRNHEAAGSIPDLVQWVKHVCCGELRCRSQMQFRSGVAVAVV